MPCGDEAILEVDEVDACVASCLEWRVGGRWWSDWRRWCWSYCVVVLTGTRFPGEEWKKAMVQIDCCGIQREDGTEGTRRTSWLRGERRIGQKYFRQRIRNH